MSFPIAMVTFSAQGLSVAHHLLKQGLQAQLFVHRDLLKTADCHTGTDFLHVRDLVSQHFHSYCCWIFIAPCGIVVRSIAPELNSKYTDPAVLVVDAGARHVVSLLSGHEGGANGYAVEVSNLLAAEPVISTTTEAVKTWIAGIGCRKGCSCEAIVELLDDGLQIQGITRDDLRFLVSAQLKKDEPGLREAADILNIPLRFIHHDQIDFLSPVVQNYSFVQQQTGLPGVAEPSALLGGRNTRLCLSRIARNGVTLALAQENCWWWE